MGEDELLVKEWVPSYLQPHEIARIREQLATCSPDGLCDPNVALDVHRSAVELLNHLDAVRRFGHP